MQSAAGNSAIDALLVHGPAALAACIVAGLALGSFLNVVVHRLPIMLDRQWRAEAMDALAIRPPRRARFDLTAPRSRCPACLAPVRARDNVPVASWLLLRGRCRDCGARISVRYPVVELAGAVLAVAVVAAWGYSWLAAAYYALLLALLALALIDFDTLQLPVEITVPLLWCGILMAFLLDTAAHPALNAGPTPGEAVLGAVSGYLALWLVYWAHKLLTGRDGMGHGDFKLLAALGAWLGWQALLPVVLIASALGLAYAGTRLALRRASLATQLPFGTFQCAAGAAVLLFGRHLPAAY